MECREFNIKATPRASTTRVVESGPVIRVYVTSPPEGGKANDAVIRALADHWNLAKSHIKITQGITSRDKVIRIGTSLPRTKKGQGPQRAD